MSASNDLNFQIPSPKMQVFIQYYVTHRVRWHWLFNSSVTISTHFQGWTGGRWANSPEGLNSGCQNHTRELGNLLMPGPTAQLRSGREGGAR